MRTIAWATALIAVQAAAAMPASAQVAKVFKPVSAWALDYGDDYCRLMRDFSDGNRTLGLFVERTQPGPVFRLIVIGDEVRLFRGATEVGYRLLPAGAPRTAQRLRFQTATGQQYLNLGPTTFADMVQPGPGTVPAMPGPYSREAEQRAATAISGIAVDRGVTAPVVIETGPLGEAAAALQACADDLITSWGLDAEKHKSLQRPAMPARPTAGWVAADTVAFADFAKLAGGNNDVRVMIDRSGKPTSCHIQWPTLDRSVNDDICASIMSNATFLPAVDAQGVAVNSYWTASVFFLLPPFGG